MIYAKFNNVEFDINHDFAAKYGRIWTILLIWNIEISFILYKHRIFHAVQFSRYTLRTNLQPVRNLVLSSMSAKQAYIFLSKKFKNIKFYLYWIVDFFGLMQTKSTDTNIWSVLCNMINYYIPVFNFFIQI